MCPAWTQIFRCRVQGIKTHYTRSKTMKTLIATAIAATLALAGPVLAEDTPAPQKKTAPAKPAAKAQQHDHDACPMMQGGMMGKGNMGMMGGAGAPDPAAHAAMEKRLEHMEKRLDMMQMMMERMLRQEPAAK
jgi:hypothetical protein